MQPCAHSRRDPLPSMRTATLVPYHPALCPNVVQGPVTLSFCLYR